MGRGRERGHVKIGSVTSHSRDGPGVDVIFPFALGGLKAGVPQSISSIVLIWS
jgi:hypothetical protein